MSKNGHTLSERDRSCIWHPYTQMKKARDPIPIVRGKGVYLYSADGSRYLDGISSWWVNLHGHAHPYIIEKMKEQALQLEHVIFADFTHLPAIELAERLLKIIPGNMSKIFYSDNGSTAVEVALKMALQYFYNRDQKTTQTKVICLKQSYHGDTFGAMSAAGKNCFNQPFWDHLFSVETIDPPIVGKEEIAISQLEVILKKSYSACFIFEPLILGSGGMITYSAKGLEHMLQLCRQHGVLTIADEVMTGFGRTGTLFACDQISEKADIICLSKGITGGFLPLGVTACTEEIYKAFLGDHLHQALLHGHSFSGNPLACACALASLDLLLDEKCTQQRKMIAKSHAAYCEKISNHPKLKRCESIGTILILEFFAETSSYFSTLRDRLYSFFLERGILLRPLGNVLYVLPPYCITRDELDFIYKTINEYLRIDYE